MLVFGFILLLRSCSITAWVSDQNWRKKFVLVHLVAISNRYNKCLETISTLSLTLLYSINSAGNVPKWEYFLGHSVTVYLLVYERRTSLHFPEAQSTCWPQLKTKIQKKICARKMQRDKDKYASVPVPVKLSLVLCIGDKPFFDYVVVLPNVWLCNNFMHFLNHLVNIFVISISN